MPFAKRYLFITIIFLPFQLFSQTVFVSYNALNSFDPTLYELFYCTLNNTSETEEVYLEVQVSKDGETILAVRSGVFTLEEGVTTINSFTAENYLHAVSDISSEYVNYSVSEDIYNQIQTTGFIPAGNYTFCLIVYNLSSETISNPDVCSTFMSWPVSPPRLLIPYNNSQTETELPLFSWTHAMPYNSVFLYCLEVVELLDGQGPYDAFQSNYLYYKSEDIVINSFQYPISALQLEDCKSYAWRVAGNYDPNLSEYDFFVFQSKCDSIIDTEKKKKKTPIASDIYYELSRTIDASFYTIKGNFKIIFDNSYGTLDKLKYSLYDKDYINIAASNTLFNTVSKDEGLLLNNNVFIVDIERLGLLNDEYYVLEVQGPKREYYLKIKYLSQE